MNRASIAKGITLSACSLLFLLATSIRSAAQSKSYSIPEIRVSADVSEDGLIRINEERTYVFNGSYSWADYRLPLRGFSEIRNIRVSEVNQSYIN